MLVLLDVRFEQAAFQQRRFPAPARNAARAHLNSRRFFTIKVPVELQTAFAPDQGPIVALGMLVQKIDWCRQIIQSTGTTGYQVSHRMDTLGQISYSDTFQL